MCIDAEKVDALQKIPQKCNVLSKKLSSGMGTLVV